MLRLLPTSLIAGTLAVVLTHASTNWFPIGPVAPFEPDRGTRWDWPVLAAAMLTALLVVPASPRSMIEADHLDHRRRTRVAASRSSSPVAGRPFPLSPALDWRSLEVRSRWPFAARS